MRAARALMLAAVVAVPLGVLLAGEADAQSKADRRPAPAGPSLQAPSQADIPPQQAPDGQIIEAEPPSAGVEAVPPQGCPDRGQKLELIS
jgi:hypothetical protein